MFLTQILVATLSQDFSLKRFSSLSLSLSLSLISSFHIWSHLQRHKNVFFSNKILSDNESLKLPKSDKAQV